MPAGRNDNRGGESEAIKARPRPPRFVAPPPWGTIRALRGVVAQLGERRVRNAKVEGSIPFHSTTLQRPPLALVLIGAEASYYGLGHENSPRVLLVS